MEPSWAGRRGRRPSSSLAAHAAVAAPADDIIVVSAGPSVVSLLEKEPRQPVGNGVRHRFSNPFPSTETNVLALGHRVINPVP